MHDSARGFPGTHPYLSTLALVAGTVAVVQTIHSTFVVPDSLPSPEHPGWNITMLCSLTVAALWNAAQPQYGGYAVVLATAIMTMTVAPVPLGVFALAIIALATLTFLDPVSGCATGITFGSLMIIYGRLVPLGIMGRGSAFTFDALIMAAIIIGASAHAITRYAAMRRRDKMIRRNLHIARELHDHTTNDLSDIIMLINRHLSETEDGEDGTRLTSTYSTEDLTTMRDLALDALRHTRHTIAALDGRPDSMPNTVPQISGTPKTGESLSDVIAGHQDRLRQLGYNGEVIASGDMDSIPEKTYTLIVDFLRELFGNIVKHADRVRGYTMLVTISDDACIIDLSDFAKPDNAAGRALKSDDLHSGLMRYRTLIELQHGVLEIIEGRRTVDEEHGNGRTGTDIAWTLHASIPV